MRRSVRVAAAAWAALAGAAAPAAAEEHMLYRYVDERGVVHFTNTPSDERFEAVRPLSRTQGMAVAPGDDRSPQGAAPRVTAFDGLIGQVASRHGVAPALVKAVIAAESNFDPAAVSRKGAMGLMQLMPATARELGVRTPFRSDENVRGGTRYLRRMMDRFGDLPRALAAYNAGPGAVDRHGGIPPYPETLAYVQRVLAYYRAYHGDFAR